MNEIPFYHSRIETDKQTLLSNAKHLLGNLKKETKATAVIKADAYGHGAVPVARVLQDSYDMFAVANVTEAVQLRKAGITHPILVFGVPLPVTAPAYSHYGLTATVSSEAHIDLLPEGTSYHVEIDSGMGRLGILPHTLERLRTRIFSEKRIHCEGIMTHFATADEPVSPLLVQQKKILREICAYFQGKIPVHAANSAASLGHPDTHIDRVRHGIALYGYDPCPAPSGKLQPVMKWKSWIAQCKAIKKGVPLSYGAVWRAPMDGYYAVVPAGYADGYPRNLSGKLPVQIAGKWYSQVGRVTMDYCMIWLEEDYHPEGTEVLVMGGERNHAGIWATLMETIPYEICCGIHPKVPRKMV